MRRNLRESFAANDINSSTKENMPKRKKKRYDEMPIKDKILLGPIEKYRKYNRFPWKFLFHIIMLVMTTF